MRAAETSFTLTPAGKDKLAMYAKEFGISQRALLSAVLWSLVANPKGVGVVQNELANLDAVIPGGGKRICQARFDTQADLDKVQKAMDLLKDSHRPKILFYKYHIIDAALSAVFESGTLEIELEVAAE